METRKGNSPPKHGGEEERKAGEDREGEGEREREREREDQRDGVTGSGSGSRSGSLPLMKACRLCAMSWAAMLMAISSGVLDPMSSPMGAFTDSSRSPGTPSARSVRKILVIFALLPMSPTKDEDVRTARERTSWSYLCPLVTMTM